MSATREYKLILVGMGGVGKTGYLTKLLLPETAFNPIYLPTLGVNVHPLQLTFESKIIQINIWDTAGQDKFGGLRSLYYKNADCAIVMMDDNKHCKKELKTYIDNIRNECGDIPIVILFNKFDLPKTVVQYNEFVAAHPDKITMHCCLKTSDDNELLQPIYELLHTLHK